MCGVRFLDTDGLFNPFEITVCVSRDICNFWALPLICILITREHLSYVKYIACRKSCLSFARCGNGRVQ